MLESTPDFYEFDGIRFYASERRLHRLTDKADFFIRPKERDFLRLLVIESRRTVRYEQFREAVWPETNDLKSVLPTIRETKRTLNSLLGEITQRRGEIIETVSKHGYRLNADVRKNGSISAGSAEAKTPIAGDSTSSETEIVGAIGQRNRSAFGGHTGHVTTSCILYAALYGLAVPLELAYRFDQFAGLAWRLIPIAFCWIGVCSIVSMYLDWRIVMAKKPFGLLVLLSSFIGAAFVLYSALIFFLPNFPITETTGFQAHSAQGAYLKNVAFYFVPLGVIFLALPYHFVLTRSFAPQGSSLVGFHFKPRTLGSILFGAAIVSLFLTFHLLNNLGPSPYRNLFTQLAILRAMLIFGTGLEAALWYSNALNRLASGPV